ncbi:MAG: NTP transferase domain-containing protein [Holophagales bacterium]|nr:NTP transferase domain-containing protein [Holophagales bacterium]MYH25249.1 NTP transferase domain-containing protein [Holophagales bacterium]
MSQGLTLAILAAGRSARFGRPKTLEPVGPGGEVLFEYAICDAIRAGCGKVVFVTSADWNDQLMSRAAEQAGGAVPVDYVIQSLDDLPNDAAPPAGRAKPWGTGHAVLALRKKIEEPFLVVNADDFYGPRAVESFGRRVGELLDAGHDSHFLAAYELHRTGVSRTSGVNRGILTAGRDSTLEGIDEVYDVRETDSGLVGRDGDGEARSLVPDCPCSMNLWGFQPSIFGLLEAAFTDFQADLGDQQQDEFLLSETVGQLISAGPAHVRLLPMTQSTAGLTYPGDLPPVATTLRQCVDVGDYPANLGDWFTARASRRPA